MCRHFDLDLAEVCHHEKVGLLSFMFVNLPTIKPDIFSKTPDLFKEYIILSMEYRYSLISSINRIAPLVLGKDSEFNNESICGF